MSATRRTPGGPPIARTLGVVFAAGCFVLAAILGKTEAGLSVNVDLTRWIQASLPTLLANPLSAALILGSNLVCLGFAAAYGLDLWRKGYGAAALAPGAVVATLAFEVTLKSLLAHPPVWEEFHVDAEWYVLPNPAEEVELPYPFPSGHALRLSFLVLVASSLLSGKTRPTVAAIARISAWLLALIGGVAVVYLGWHWTTDAVGGVALGYIAAVATTVVVQRAKRVRART